MIIQKVIKGISLSRSAEEQINELIKDKPYLTTDQMRDEELKIISPQVQKILDGGILCNWWLNLSSNGLPVAEIPKRLTDRNLYWHQNCYNKPDPLTGYKPFKEETPFISTTAGTVERQSFFRRNKIHRARDVALKFATQNWQRTGILFYCYVFIIGKKATGHEAFAEELRELNIYTGYSPFQPEGEITSKIEIPPAQIECAEIWLLRDFEYALKNRNMLAPSKVMQNKLHLKPEDYANIRELL